MYVLAIMAFDVYAFADLAAPSDPGPEGGPGVHCGLGKDAQCSFGNCDPDTIEIEVQESVVCGGE